MATTGVTGLFPPLIETFSPAQLKGEKYKINFSLSDFNSLSEDGNISEYAQVSIVRQDNNKNILDLNKYPASIKIAKIKEEKNSNNQIDETNDYRYYIELIEEDIIMGSSPEDGYGFKTDIIFKVQIRFMAKQIEEDSSFKNFISIGERLPISWFADHLNDFSEWSTVNLLKIINAPSINLLQFSEDQINIIESPMICLAGNFTYTAESKLGETLKSYSIKILKENKSYFTSDIIYTDAYSDINSINYFIPRIFVTGVYIMQFTYSTSSNYSETISYEFKVNIKYTEDNPEIKTIKVDNDNGIIQLKINRGTKGMKILVGRVNSKDNFSTCELIHQFSGEKESYIFNDMTVEGGIFYKYFVLASGKFVEHYIRPLHHKYVVLSIPKEGITGVINLSPAVICILEDAVLTTKDQQLKLNLSLNIGNIAPTLSENQTTTIGGRYPFIQRNGNLKYRNFSLSGMVHSYMNTNDLFLSFDKDIYASEEVANLYKQYNLEHPSTIYHNHIDERQFRDKVIEFLQDGEVKLFRSTQEGNLLVRLMDVNITPNVQLGRLIANFSCNAIEIADCNIDNFKEYNIIDFFDETSAKELPDSFGIPSFFYHPKDNEEVINTNDSLIRLEEGNNG